ncbi:MAG: TIGR04282 family arsenosugar biosynthesis glycosyltransferase [Planctomycetes bacterium]|nr:TIGR04282 family arsenosugar biosynthesis glycosyltransferase [Planctomycetota bacterium]
MLRTRLTTIFAKLPRAGEVKTRLCPPLESLEAAALAEAMLADGLARCLACDSFRTQLSVHPPGSQPWFHARFPELAEIVAQEGADLGTRLAAHFEHAFARERLSSAIVVGSDAPEVPLERLREAHERLSDGADLVLGPDGGGGYYLVGLRRACGALFTEVAMSAPGMYARTLELARDRRLVVAELERGDDVDTAADLERLRASAARARGGELLEVRRWFERYDERGASFTAVP